MDNLTSGKLAAAAKVGREALRFYERMGLLPKPPRAESGYRLYPVSAVARIRFIQQGQRLGFSLREISELLDLRTKKGRTCKDVQGMAFAKVREVEEKIRDLREIRKALARLADRCSAGAPMGECPILEYLENHGATLERGIS